MRLERKYLFKRVYLNSALEDLKIFAKSLNKYNVHSTYFDNLEEELYRQKIDGDKDKVKLRVRHYNQDEATSQIEAKVKFCDRSHKIRMPNSFVEIDAARLLPKDMRSSYFKNNGEIGFLLKHYCLRPTIDVFYDRYEMVVDELEKCRVTIDKDVFCQLRVPWPANRMRSLNHEICILEVKTTSKTVNEKMKLVLEKYHMKQRAVSKFALSVQAQKLNSRMTNYD